MTPSPRRNPTLEPHLALGVQSAERALQEAHSRDTGIGLERVSSCPMSAISAEDLADDGGCVAGAALRFSGAFSGSALFSMAPEDALLLARARRDAPDPISSFLAFGERVVGEALAAIAARLEATVAVGRASLVEDGVAALLFGTHAPPDTAVVVTRLGVRCGAEPCEPLSAHLILLFDPKTLDALLAS